MSGSKQKLWGGRFKKSLDSAAVAYSYSLHVDKRLLPYDVKVNLAHGRALEKAGILSAEEIKQLSEYLPTLASKEVPLDAPDEDIHSYVERCLTEVLGDLGKKIHTGKSRNDQVITDVRLFLKDAIGDIQEAIRDVLKTLWTIADANKAVVFPGFTHFQPAQPVLLAHHLLAYVEKFARDLNRFDELLSRVDVCPLGSGALAGNNYGLDRAFIARELGFSSLTQNSMDGVSDRDFLVEFCSFASLCMSHLNQSCEELVLWSSPLVGFITIGDDFTTGSSIMPQKKNPDIAELMRGKSGRVMGHLVGIHHILKGLPLTYNRDLQEDKEILFDTVDTLLGSLTCYARMMASICFNKQRIDEALDKGYLEATEIADYLVKKGVPFREAHEITGRIVLYAVEKQLSLSRLSFQELHSFSPHIDEGLMDAIKISEAVSAKSVLGGTAHEQVSYQLDRIKESFGW